jgi:tripartite-type tricarboxylate transporter receptor subunit TctC
MVNREAGYTMSDFEPIANMIFDPGILVVAPDSKYKSLNDLIDAAKKAPGTIKLSHSGEGGDDWYNALMIEKLTGTKFNLIPFDGDAPAMQAAMGGHVDACTTNVGVVTGLVRGKKLRGLAVYTPQRLASISEVPTLKELGVNLIEGSYRGYLAPKGTPKEIIKTLADALEKVSKDPQFLEASAAINMVPQFKRDQELKTFLDEQEAMLRKVAKEMKLIQ